MIAMTERFTSAMYITSFLSDFLGMTMLLAFQLVFLHFDVKLYFEVKQYENLVSYTLLHVWLGCESHTDPFHIFLDFTMVQSGGGPMLCTCITGYYTNKPVIKLLLFIVE